MACRIANAKPLSEPMLIGPQRANLIEENLIEVQTFPFIKKASKNCRLENGANLSRPSVST